ncbi:MAG: response regulator [Bacteroidota bacterium]|jgi:two-component system copper resistance phosphate regulon response regulator CusR
MKILVIEDEPKVASFIKQGLEEQSYAVTVAYDGFFGHKLATENEFDVILLDLMIPYMNGLEVCKKLREEGIKTPILMLTALGTTDDKVTGLESGADDYLVKPFEFKELVARIRALSKRFNSAIQTPKVLKIADLEMNLDQKSVKRSGKSIELTAKEFALLEFLLKNKNRVVSRSEISEKVWDIHFDTGTNVIDVYVNFLRKKIDRDFEKKLIHTMVGMGYVIKSDDEN